MAEAITRSYEWRKLRKEHPDVVERIRKVGNVRLVLESLKAPAGLELYVSTRVPDVVQVLAERELELRARFEAGDAAAGEILRTDFGFGQAQPSRRPIRRTGGRQPRYRET